MGFDKLVGIENFCIQYMYAYYTHRRLAAVLPLNLLVVEAYGHAAPKSFF